MSLCFKVIYPAYKKKNVYMPASCPFVEERDMYYPHETHKTEEAYARWACEYCGKVFYAETYLDEHLQNRHADKIFKVTVENMYIPPLWPKHINFAFPFQSSLSPLTLICTVKSLRLTLC